MFRKILSNTAVYGLAPYIPKLASFFTLPLITRELTAYDYGIAGLAAAYSFIFQSFVVLGLNVSFTNSYFKHPKNYLNIWRHLYGALLYWTILYVGLQYFLLDFLLPADIDNRLLVIALVISPPLFFGPAAIVCGLKYQYEKKSGPVAIRNLISGFLIIALNVYFIVGLKLGFLGWFLADFIVNSLRHFSYWISLRYVEKIKPIYSIRFKYIKSHLASSLAIIPHNYSSFLLRSSDKIVLDKLGVSPNSIGLYNLASNFGNYFSTFGVAFTMAVNPFLYSSFTKRDQKESIYILKNSIALFFILTISFCLFSKEIFGLMIKNEALASTYPMAILLIMCVNYRPLYVWFSSFLILQNNAKALATYAFILGALNVALNLIFVSSVGFEVAAITTFVCYTMYGIIGFRDVEIRKMFGSRVLNIAIGSSLLSCAFTYAIGVFVEYAIWLKFLLLLFAIIIILWIYCKDGFVNFDLKSK